MVKSRDWPNLGPFCPYVSIFGKKLAFKNFWIFWDYGIFWGSFSLDFGLFLGHFEPNWTKNLKICRRMTRKSKKNLSVFLKASFLPKMKEYRQNGTKFYCLEANFRPPKSTFSIHFVKFREYLGITAIFFNSVTSSWIPIVQILNMP